MQEATLRAIAESRLFRGVAPRAVIDAIGAVRNVRAGRRLATAGRPARAAFVLLAGELLAIEDLRGIHVVSLVRPGEAAGEEAVWGAPAYLRTVVTRTAATVAVLPAATLGRHALSDASLAYNVAAMMFARVRDARMLAAFERPDAR